MTSRARALALAVVVAAAVTLPLAGAGCVISPVHYSYPRLAEEVELACDRLERTIEVASDEGGHEPVHARAAEAIIEARTALERERLAQQTVDLLESAARKLDAVAAEARRSISGHPSVAPPGAPPPTAAASAAPTLGPRPAARPFPGARQDRLYDLAEQARRAAAECRTLARSVAGDLPPAPPPPGLPAK